MEMFPLSTMRYIALKHIPVMKKRIQGGMDKDGHRFKMYSVAYADKKGNKFRSEITGKRYKYPRERISSSKVFPPDLTLTGLMLGNLHRKRQTKRYYTIGFTGEAGDKVRWNKSMGRNIEDGIPNREKRFLSKLLDKDLKRQASKLKSVTIDIGK